MREGVIRPLSVFVMALSTASLPSLSKLAARGARGEFATSWAHGFGLAWFEQKRAANTFVVGSLFNENASTDEPSANRR